LTPFKRSYKRGGKGKKGGKKTYREGRVPTFKVDFAELESRKRFSGGVEQSKTFLSKKVPEKTGGERQKLSYSTGGKGGK